MVAGVFSVQATPTTGPLSVGRFHAAAPGSLGNVGVSLSGGGSRALTAAMGQLRALKKLNANGRSLLAQTKALSTVSGGAWLGVPFVYLPPGAPSDAAYLGPWIDDQSTLTPAMLEHLPAGNAGVPISSPLFAPRLLAAQALLLRSALRVPPDMLWQTLIGLNILADYGLYAPTARLTPTDTFSFDAATAESRIAKPNPALANAPVNLYADACDRKREHRPFLICNSAMFLEQPDSALQLLAPVQATPFITGVLGTPAGEDANGRKPGGGGIDTFGFNSACASVSGGDATVAQARQWSLTDAVGTSSAFFAEVLQNLFHRWRRDPADLAALMAREADTILHWIRTKLPVEARGAAIDRLRLDAHPSLTRGALLRSVLSDLQDVIPRYQCWSVRDPQPGMPPLPNRFADGGSLENTGVAALLAYSDIDGVIAFVNPSVPLQPAAYGVADGRGGVLPGTAVVVDDSVPPLFGYQPYGAGRPGENEGYVPYGEGPPGRRAMHAHNQVFERAAFPALLRGLWAASGGETHANPAIFAQRLAVKPNPWFGVTSAREVTVVWCYLGFVTAWAALFADNQPVLAIIEAERAANGFPNYSTLDTHLSATQINLLANLTAWSVNKAEERMQVFSRLFRATS
jgi:hypothetical protein